MFNLYFDGLFRNLKDVSDAGVMCFGWLLLQDSHLIAYGYGAVARGRDATSNIAEYMGLIDGLEAMVDMSIGYDPVVVYGDAKSIIHQMLGRSKVSTHRVQPMYRKARRLARQLYVTDWRWIPRQQNKSADQLSRRALSEIRANPKTFQDAWRDVLQDHVDHRNSTRELGGMLVYQPLT